MADSAVIELEAQYCPPLDAGLYRAIVSDYDLTNPVQLAEAREILDGLKTNALLEQQTDFDPSGASHPLDETNAPGGTGHRGGDRDTSGAFSEDVVSQSGVTGVTSITDSVRSLDIASESSGTAPPNYDEGIEDLPLQEKEELLVVLCEAKKFDVEHALKKNSGNFLKTLDELLNQSWLKENAAGVKSIDGFFHPSDDTSSHHQRKGKKKARNRKHLGVPSSQPHHGSTTASSDGSGSTSPEPDQNGVVPPPKDLPNVWAARARDLAYLTDRIPNLNSSALSKVYHSNGASIHRTLLSLCKTDPKQLNPVLSQDDTAIQLGAATLLSIPDVSTLQPQQAIALNLLTHPSIHLAIELAKTLLYPSYPTTTPSISQPLTANSDPHPLTVIPYYTRPSIPPPSHSSLSISSTLHPPQTLPTLNSAISHATTLRNTRLSQASAAYRLSRSNPLLSAASAHYASLARSANQTSRTLTSAAADALVSQQSSKESIDLHGVGAEDAVRIVLQKVGQWWEGQERLWEREGVVGGEHGGFRIVTGRGEHSGPGGPRVRPRVLKALREGGWRVSEDGDLGGNGRGGSGVLVVVGRVRGGRKG